MPANRSRTTEWRRCLQQLHERNGALEIAIAREDDGNEMRGNHLVWRVRLLGVTETEILVEQPVALGQEITLQAGIDLVVVLSIGQNRWMFRARNIGPIGFRLNDRKTTSAIRLAMPQNVERCQRRTYYRVETAALVLPRVDVWPLLDPRSVLLAERANEVNIQMHDSGDSDYANAASAFSAESETMLPEVGLKFPATLLNLGGGGIGLRVEPQSAAALGHHKVFWVRFSLPPELSTPVCATGKLVHTHMDSTQCTYAGLAFDFSFNPAHQRFVVDQICRYIAIQQRAQLQRQAATARSA